MAGQLNGKSYPWFETRLTTNSVRFAGDSIVSKASRESTILVWQIDGFNSDLTPPPEEAHRVTLQTPTASSFGGKFQRLQTLGLPGAGLAPHFALAGRREPVVVYADVRGVYSWNLAHAAAKARWDSFEAVGPESVAPAKALVGDAAWAWEEPARLAVGGGGVHVAVGMREGLVCLLVCGGWSG
jgi:hypothetical protein